MRMRKPNDPESGDDVSSMGHIAELPFQRTLGEHCVQKKELVRRTTYPLLVDLYDHGLHDQVAREEPEDLYCLARELGRSERARSNYPVGVSSRGLNALGAPVKNDPLRYISTMREVCVGVQENKIVAYWELATIATCYAWECALDASDPEVLRIARSIPEFLTCLQNYKHSNGGCCELVLLYAQGLECRMREDFSRAGAHWMQAASMMSQHGSVFGQGSRTREYLRGKATKWAETVDLSI